MKTMFIILLLLAACQALCQRQDLQLFNDDSKGRPLYLTVNFASEGSPYLADDYYLAQVTLLDGTLYKNERVKINLLDHLVQYLKKDGTEMITEMPVKSVVFNNIPDEDGKNVTIQLESFSGPLNTPEAVLYSVLDNGRYKLLKKITVVYRDDKKYNDASTTRVFEKKESFYSAGPDGNINKLEKGRPAMLALFKENTRLVAGYINEHRLSCRTEADFREIFHFNNLQP